MKKWENCHGSKDDKQGLSMKIYKNELHSCHMLQKHKGNHKGGYLLLFAMYWQTPWQLMYFNQILSFHLLGKQNGSKVNRHARISFCRMPTNTMATNLTWGKDWLATSTHPDKHAVAILVGKQNDKNMVMAMFKYQLPCVDKHRIN